MKLGIITHHIVCDGWSFEVFFRELGELYRVFDNGATSLLPELRFQYADYAWSERRNQSQQNLEEEVTFWARRMDDAPILAFPSEPAPLSGAAGLGASREFVLQSNIYTQLQSLSRVVKTSLATTLLATFCTLLFRFSRQSDFVIGAPLLTVTAKDLRILLGSLLI